MNEERHYAKVVEELRHAGPIAGLWAKAFAEAGGVDSAAKALYLRLRVAQLADEERRAEVEAALEAKQLDGPWGWRSLTMLQWTSLYVVVVCVAAGVSLWLYA